MARDWLPPLERLDETRFRADPIDSGGRRVFGGEMMAQAVAAAQQTLPEFQMHALSTQFLRPCELGTPVIYEVDTLSHGRRFSRLALRILQNDKLASVSLLSLTAIADPEPRQARQLPPPATQALDPDHMERFGNISRVLKQRGAISVEVTEISDDGCEICFRARPRAPGPVDPASLCAYVSDRLVMSAAQLGTAFASGLGGDSGLGQITLNHELRIHAPVPQDQTLYQRIRADVWGLGRCACSGEIMDADGNRLASFVQEGLVG